ncbi:oligoribonuclease [Myxococcota bacterium]|nr:oligoribonuclease [Myxococcota bacterium]
MAEKLKDALVWLDMEMTGLDPATCVPVEVAVIITTKDLEEKETYEATIWQPESALSTMVPFVRRMHTNNGLLDKVRKAETSVTDVERKLIEVLLRWCEPREGVLAGNSIHQDRKFIDLYFPTFSALLHYRMVDVSTIKELTKRWYGPDVAYSKGESDHTALSDIRSSINELRHYKAKLFK